MSLYFLASRISSVEYTVDDLANKANSANSVFTGTTSINGPDLLNGPVAFGSSITGINITDVSGLQSSLGQKAPLASSSFMRTVNGITKSMVGLANVDNTAEPDKPISKDTELAYNILLEMIGAKANKVSPTFSGSVASTTHQTRTNQYQVRLGLLSMQRLR